MESGFELFDHTADLGIRVFAPTLPGLVPVARDALYSVIGDLVPAAEAPALILDLSDDDAGGLLRDFLAELLRRFESRSEICTSINVAEFSPRRLRVECVMTAVDAEKSDFFREVKAVTYHELAAGPVAGGYEARLIVDI